MTRRTKLFGSRKRLNVDWPLVANMSIKARLEYIWRVMPCISPVRVLGVDVYNEQFIKGRMVWPKYRAKVKRQK